MTCSSSTISTPERRVLRHGGYWWLALLAAALAGSAGAAPSREAAGLIDRARAALAASDGIAAEARLDEALAAGAARSDVAALMGEAWLDQGDLEKAREWLGSGQFSSKDAATGWRNLARLERAEGNLPAAGRAYDRALALAPRDPVLWVDIGRLRYAGGEHLLAIEAADRALALGPGHPRALEFKGQLVRDSAGLAAALPWFERGITAAPDDLDLLADYAATLGDMGRARDMLVVARRMVELDPRDARPFYFQAVLAARAGRDAEARSILNRAKGRLDHVPGALLLDGVLNLRAGNPDLAVEVLDRLARRQPANALAQDLLARALFAAGEDLYLVQRFAPAAARPGASPYLLVLVGRALENLDRRAEAAPFLDRAAREAPGFVSPVAEGSPLGAMLAMGQGSAALAMTARDLAAAPGSAIALSRAGDARLAMGDGEAAFAYYSRAAGIRLSESLALRMVEALSRAGRGAEAVALTEAFLARQPGSRAAAYLAAGLAGQRGDWARARALLDHLVRTGGGRDPRLLADLSLACLKAGDVDAALAAGERAWRLHRASPAASQAWGMALAAKGGQDARAKTLLLKARATGGENPLLAEALVALEAR